MFQGSKVRLVRRAENLAAIYEPIVWTWDLQATARGPDMPGIRPAIVYFDYIVKFTM
jgi:hypothetical protein